MQRFISKVCFLFIGTICVLLFLGMLCTNYNHSYTYKMMNEMYNFKGNIDIVFLGSSHVYRSYDPKLADRILGLNTYNAGSSGQNMLTSYYLLKEICQYNDVKTVYVDTYYALTGQEMNDTSVYYISDYMRGMENKTTLLYESDGINRVIYGYLPFRRNIDNLTHIVENIKSRYVDLSDYSVVSYNEEEYRGNGFVFSFETIRNINDVDFSYCSEFDYSNGVPQDCCYYNYLIKIIDYCKKNNIEVVLVDQPMLKQNIDQVIDYDNYVQFHRQLASKYNIDYWNFNLYKDEIGLDITDYKDANHLNGKGAEKYTSVLCDVIAKKAKLGNVDDLFLTCYK